MVIEELNGVLGSIKVVSAAGRVVVISVIEEEVGVALHGDIGINGLSGVEAGSGGDSAPLSVVDLGVSTVHVGVDREFVVEEFG